MAQKKTKKERGGKGCSCLEGFTMSQSFEWAAKQLLTQMGKSAGFNCKNEYRLKIEGYNRYVAYVDHVWLAKVPHPFGYSRDFAIVAFEITNDLTALWNMKKMKGDVENLRLSGASLGVLVIPTVDALKGQAEKLGYGSTTWLANLKSYLEVLKKIAFPLRLEVWCFDHKNNKLSIFE